jgi:molybdopterin-guanine dinucleotide biosynthesis protein A
MKEQVKGLYGLVLAGGKSSRMGRDKSMLEFHGMPQKDYAFQLLSASCEKVYTSVSATAALSDFKNPIVDQFSFGGPINGILSALQFRHDVAWLALPVDMPLVNQPTISLLIHNRDETQLATCFRHKRNGNLEPLLAIWEPQCRKPLLDFCKKGGCSPNEFLKTTEVHYVEIEDDKLLTSINSPTDIEALKGYMPNRNQN